MVQAAFFPSILLDKNLYFQEEENTGYNTSKWWLNKCSYEINKHVWGLNQMSTYK